MTDNEKTLLMESTISDKIDDILDDISSDQRYSMPDKRKDLISDIISEFARSKADVVKLKDKIQEKLDAGDKKIMSIYNKVAGLNPEIIKILGKASEKLHKILDNGRTGDPSVKKFISEFIVDVAGFSDEDLRAAMKIENEIANALK